MKYYAYIKKYKSVLFIAFAVLFRFVVLFLARGGEGTYLHVFINGDDDIYMSYCENVFALGEYVYNSDYTFRMPGMLILYAPLRLFLSYELALEVFLYLQIIFSGIATYYLAKATEIICNNKKAFYISFFLNCFAFYMHAYDGLFFTESLAISSISISLYAYIKALNTLKIKYFIVSGFFAMWFIFLRPFLLPFFILLCIILFYKYYKKEMKIAYIIMFIAPFFIAITIWTTRNFYKTQRFIPLQTSTSWMETRPESYKKMRELLITYGFRWESWRDNSQSGWFENVRWNKHRDDLFPAYMFDSVLTLDTLKYARDNMLLCNKNSHITTQTHNEDAVIRIYQAFIDKEKSNIIQYQILNRMRLVKAFWEPQGALLFPAFNTALIKNILEPIALFIWYFIVVFGYIGILLYSIKKFKNSIFPLIISCVPLFVFFYFPIYARIDEVRFTITAFPFLIITATYMVVYVIKNMKNVILDKKNIHE